MSEYIVLRTQIYNSGNFSLVPIRFEDRYEIMKWRNEQIYHLRQNKPLTKEVQDSYFENEIAKLFDQEKPNQLLFSFLENGDCIGYGGLVHINWIDQNAEISFIMQTEVEQTRFAQIWSEYLSLIEKVAFDDLGFHKIYTYAFDLRPHLYPVLKDQKFSEDLRLKEHCINDGVFIDVVIHSKLNERIKLVRASEINLGITYKWATNKSIRKYSFNQAEISFDEHAKWFLEKIASKNYLFYILKRGEQPIGSIRIDISDDDSGIISFLIDEQYHGKGFGKIILELMELEINQIVTSSFRLIGFVKSENVASIKTFKKLNYKQVKIENGVITFEKFI
jgi:RimJ/RimL family protein N-acetyltransferase